MDITTSSELLNKFQWMSTNFHNGTGKIEEVRGDINGIALDIDETLSWTGGYWMEQMQLLFGNPENLSVEEMFSKYKLCQHVPYWQDNPEACQWMHEKRSCKDTQRNLPVIAGSVEGANAIKETVGVPIVAYITVRPASLAEGTAEWLLSRGFPSAALICKPDDVPFEQGNVWKAGVLEELWPYIHGIVDDNPTVLLSFTLSYRGIFFLFGHNEEEAQVILNKLRAKDELVGDGTDGHMRCRVMVCPTWPSVVAAVEQNKPELTSGSSVLTAGDATNITNDTHDLS